MRVSILPENDIARNLDVVISRGRVQPEFRDDNGVIRERDKAKKGKKYSI